MKLRVSLPLAHVEAESFGHAALASLLREALRFLAIMSVWSAAISVNRANCEVFIVDWFWVLWLELDHLFWVTVENPLFIGVNWRIQLAAHGWQFPKTNG